MRREMLLGLLLASASSIAHAQTSDVSAASTARGGSAAQTLGDAAAPALDTQDVTDGDTGVVSENGGAAPDTQAQDSGSRSDADQAKDASGSDAAAADDKDAPVKPDDAASSPEDTTAKPDDAATSPDTTPLDVPAGAPIPATSYDPSQSYFNFRGTGVGGGSRARDSGLFEERGLVPAGSLDRYRSLARSTSYYTTPAVLDRSRSAYDPLGIRTGGFTLFPTAGITAGYTTNARRQQDAASDVYGVGSAELLARSNWGRHQVVLDAVAQQQVYGKFTSENTLTYALNAAGRLDVNSAITLFGSAAHEYDYANRRSVVEALVTQKPVRFFEDTVEGRGVVKLGRFDVSAGLIYETRDYRNSFDPFGNVIDTQIRDFHSWTGEGRVAFRLPSRRLVFVAVSREYRRFRVPANPLRDVNVTEVEGGIAGEITPLLQGRIGVGYIWGDFLEPNVANARGMSANVQLTYLLTPLTNFRLTAERNLRNVALPNSAAAFYNEIGLEVNHELLRNLILTGDLSYRVGEYLGTSSTRSYGYNSGIGALYLINRNLRARGDLGYSWSRNNSVLLPRSQDTLQVSVGLDFQL